MRGDGDDGNSGTVWKLILSYDGTDFHGWQVQPGRPTLQGTLAEAIASVTGEQVLPQGSGRTDAGVHAWGQVASFSLRAAIPAENLQRALNRILPAAIRILSAEHAAEGFHARHSAVGKVYQYRIFRGGICSPFMARYVSVCRWPLDLEAMQSAADMILGEHDFTSFAAFDPDRTARLEEGNANGDGEESFAAPPSGNIRRIETSRWSRDSLLPWPGAVGTTMIGPQADGSSDATWSGGGEDSHLYSLRQWISASHGAQPGGNVCGGRAGSSGSGGDSWDTGGSQSRACRSDGGGQRPVPDKGSVLNGFTRIGLGLRDRNFDRLSMHSCSAPRIPHLKTTCRNRSPSRPFRPSANWLGSRGCIALSNGFICRKRSCGSGTARWRPLLLLRSARRPERIG